MRFSRLHKGLFSDLPSSLEYGTVYVCTDTKQVFFGQEDKTLVEIRDQKVLQEINAIKEDINAKDTHLKSEIEKTNSTVEANKQEANSKIEHLTEQVNQNQQGSNQSLSQLEAKVDKNKRDTDTTISGLTQTVTNNKNDADSKYQSNLEKINANKETADNNHSSNLQKINANKQDADQKYNSNLQKINANKSEADRNHQSNLEKINANKSDADSKINNLRDTHNGDKQALETSIMEVSNTVTANKSATDSEIAKINQRLNQEHTSTGGSIGALETKVNQNKQDADNKYQSNLQKINENKAYGEATYKKIVPKRLDKVDLNTVIIAGEYVVAECPNSPVSYGRLHVLSWSSDAWVTQVFYEDIQNKVYTRCSLDALSKTWTPWTCLYSPTNKPTPNDLGAYNKGEVDQRDTNTLNSAKAYTYSKSEIDSKDTSTLNNAKGYTDSIKNSLNDKINSHDHDARYFRKDLAQERLVGKDLNNYVAGGIYAVKSNCSNMPPINEDGIMTVLPWDVKQWCVQIFCVSPGTDIYSRSSRVDSGGEIYWTEWSKTYNTSSKPTPAEIGALGKTEKAESAKNADTVGGKSFVWEYGTGNPTHIWGTNEGAFIAKVWDPQSITVGRATRSNTADSVSWKNVGDRPTSLKDLPIDFTNVGALDLNTYNTGLLWISRTGNASPNRPRDYSTVINFGGNGSCNGQMAWNYDNSELDLKFRKRHDNSGNYSEWRTIYHEGHKPSPNEIGTYTKGEIDQKDSSVLNNARSYADAKKNEAVSYANGELAKKLNKAGDTMTGNLEFRGGDSPVKVHVDISGTWARGIEFYKNNQQIAGMGLSGVDSEVNHIYLGVREGAWSGEKSLKITKDACYFDNKRVYYEGYKPSPADIGAVSKRGDTIEGRLNIGQNGKYANVGVGDDDVAIQNTKSGKWLQLKDNGTLAYSNRSIQLAPQKSPLWSGATYLNKGQNFTPSKPLSQCQNGWVLVFSDYDVGGNPNGNDYNWATFFVPKNSAIVGSGNTFFLVPNTEGGGSTVKVAYITDTQVLGQGDMGACVGWNDVVLREILEY